MSHYLNTNQWAECKKKSVLVGADVAAEPCAVNPSSCSCAWKRVHGRNHLVMRRSLPCDASRVVQRHDPCHAVPENSSMPSKITVIVFQPMLVDKVSVMPPKKAGKKGAQMTPAFDAADADDHEDLQTIIAGDTG